MVCSPIKAVRELGSERRETVEAMAKPQALLIKHFSLTSKLSLSIDVLNFESNFNSFCLTADWKSAKYRDINLAICWKISSNVGILVYRFVTSNKDQPETISRKD